MNIPTEKTEIALVIRPEGRLDTSTVEEFENEVLPTIRQSGQDVLIDFGRLEYISSAGLRSMLLLAKMMKKNEKKLALYALSKPIQEVFRISGFDTIIPVCPTYEEGLSFLKGESMV